VCIGCGGGRTEPAGLIFRGAGAWWIGYLGFTGIGGLRLAPLHRSEGWGGIVGALLVLILYLRGRRNRAALMLCRYGILGGGLAFALAVFLRHPVAIHWGPFRETWPQWRFAECSFGFFMGLALALGARRLIRDGLASPGEDRAPAPLNVYAVIVVLLAIDWMNFPTMPRRCWRDPTPPPRRRSWVWQRGSGSSWRARWRPSRCSICCNAISAETGN
jgi:hypothetical protein